MKKDEPIGPTAVDLADKLVAQPYAWPGGYPMHAVCDDGGVLCKACCESERDEIASSERGESWHINMLTCNWEDAELFCDHCNERIESAYAEPEEE